ncbi:killer cell lectin-like receptor subfamily B member 1B allele B [Pipra filicauda]|uniref:Killer cell lectin-like receptor subfamily B member 1B allele B n=1 Tax=Pipra filicauda TaxID=649802 RepID=A0A6J2I6N0_9PASS|nr:killer cell lectin-like receptor subfamily B member 1B allele B [Pipra filicauda]
MLGRTKCYWVSERMNSWHGSREDCGDRGAAMAMPWDKDELDSLNETLRKPTRHFWIGLSVPAPGMGWTWVNGSRPDWSRFPQDLGEGPGACGALKGRQDRPPRLRHGAAVDLPDGVRPDLSLHRTQTPPLMREKIPDSRGFGTHRQLPGQGQNRGWRKSPWDGRCEGGRGAREEEKSNYGKNKN